MYPGLVLSANAAIKTGKARPLAALTLTRLSALPDVAPDEGLEAWIHASVQAELKAQTAATQTGDDGDVTADVAARYTDWSGRSFEPVWLVYEIEGELRVAGVLALQVMSGPRNVPPRSLLSQIARQLLEHGDVRGAAARI